MHTHRFLLALMAASLVLLVCCSPVEADSREGANSLWVWVLVILVAAVLLGWLLGYGSKEEEELSAEVDMATPSHAVEMPSSIEEPSPPGEEVGPPAPDDLKLIEGIGPRIAGLLQEAGIATFAQLASTEVSRLEQIVRDAGITIADPTTWPDQARLAAAGKWDEFEALLGELKGGRRV